MAMIRCWECSKEISDSALQCPHCGAQRKEAAAAEAEARKYSAVPWGKIALGALAVVGVIVFVQIKTDPVLQRDRQHVQNCIDELERARKANMDVRSFIEPACERMKREFYAKHRMEF